MYQGESRGSKGEPRLSCKSEIRKISKSSLVCTLEGRSNKNFEAFSTNEVIPNHFMYITSNQTNCSKNIPI